MLSFSPTSHPSPVNEMYSEKSAQALSYSCSGFFHAECLLRHCLHAINMASVAGSLFPIRGMVPHLVTSSSCEYRTSMYNIPRWARITTEELRERRRMGERKMSDFLGLFLRCDVFPLDPPCSTHFLFFFFPCPFMHNSCVHERHKEAREKIESNLNIMQERRPVRSSVLWKEIQCRRHEVQ